MSTDKGYKMAERRYLSDQMKQMSYEELCLNLGGLSLEELKVAFSAGIPGDAHLYARNLQAAAEAAIALNIGNKTVGEYLNVAVEEKEDDGTESRDVDES